MANTIQLRGNRVLGNESSPYIVAELNSSHNGNIEIAKQMIDAAKDCGCDCVKFQSWSSDTLYCEEYYKNNPISKRIIAKFSLNEDQLKILSNYCLDKHIDFSSTPYSVKEVDFLVEETNAPFIKIASMEINNLSFLRYIASKGLPIVLSTGMSTIEEIRTAVHTIECMGNHQICILHCVSMYPAEMSIINLNNIKLLQEEFPQYLIGYSDHTIGHVVAAASVAMGAVLIEKHFTLDNKKMGMDNNMATEPIEMKKLVEACHNVFAALGNKQRIVLEGEEEQKLKMRRSLVATRDIPAGTVLTEGDIEAKRPGYGISPSELDSVIGKKTTIDIPKGYLFRHESLY